MSWFEIVLKWKLTSKSFNRDYLDAKSGGTVTSKFGGISNLKTVILCVQKEISLVMNWKRWLSLKKCLCILNGLIMYYWQYYYSVSLPRRLAFLNNLFCYPCVTNMVVLSFFACALFTTNLKVNFHCSIFLKSKHYYRPTLKINK